MAKLPSADALLKIAMGLDIVAKRSGAMGLSISAMRKYLVEFNNALRLAAPTLSQFGITMDQVRFQAAELSQEFNIAPEQVFELYEALEKGFTVPPFDRVADGLRVARAMFGYSEEAVTKFFQKMEKLAELGPQFEDFIGNFVKLQSISLQDQSASTAELEKHAKLGKQALLIALTTGDITRQQYTSRVAMFNLAQQHNAVDANRAQVADTQMQIQTRAAALQKAFLLQSGGVQAVMEVEAAIAGEILELAKNTNLTEEDRNKIADEMNAKIENMKSKGGEAAEAAKLLEKNYGDILNTESEADKLLEEMKKKEMERLEIMLASGDITAEELQKQMDLMATEAARNDVIARGSRTLSAVLATYKAISEESKSQISLQTELNRFLSKVGETSSDIFQNMGMSNDELIATHMESVAHAAKAVKANEMMLKIIGDVNSGTKDGSLDKDEQNKKIEEGVAALRSMNRPQQEIDDLIAYGNALRENDVAMLAESEAKMNAQLNANKQNLVVEGERFKIAEMNAAAYDYQRQVIDVAIQQAGLQVELADNLAKGVGASVEARLKEADAMSAQINLLQEEKALNESFIKDLKEKMATESMTDEQKTVALGNLKDLRLANQKIENDTLSLQMKQVGALKQLRDGFIDAITAMTTGAGVFNEIVIDQDQNLGAFMRTTDEAVSVLRTGSSSGKGAGMSRHGIGGFTRGAAPSGDYDIAPSSVQDLIDQATASRISMEENAEALGVIGDINDRQLQSLTAIETALVNTASPENASKIGSSIADLIKKAIVQAQKKLVEDGFMSAG